MRSDIGTSLRYSFLIALGLALALSVMQPSLCHADKLKDLQSLRDDASRLVNRSRGLAVAILKEIKSLDQVCRGSGGEPVKDKKPLARQILGRIEPLTQSFDNNARSAEKSIDKFKSQFSRIESPGAAEKGLKEEVEVFITDVAKYRGYVRRFYDRTVQDFGSPVKPRQGAVAVTTISPQKAPGLRITGEVSGGAGSSAYKRPHADPKTSLTSSDLNVKIAGTFAPSPLTQINFRGTHQNTIEQRKIALTKVGAGINHAFQGGAHVDLDLGYSGYNDDANDALDFGEFSVGGGLGYAGDRIGAKVAAKHVSRSYKELKTADYKILTVGPDVNISAGKGFVNLGLGYLSKSNEVEFLDHRELSPYFRWEFSPGGPELNFQYQQFTHPNQDDSEEDNNRIKASFYNKKGSSSGKVTYGPEVLIYKYPNAEEKDFADYGFVFSQQLFGREASLLSIRVVYRMYEDTLQYDFAQASFRKSRRPAGSGFSYELNLAGRYYTESSDRDDPLRFSNVHPPHTLDYYHQMGWIRTGKGTLREVAFGPIVGAKFYMDTERDDAFENDIDYVWRNPRNTVLGGVHFRTVILASPAFRIRAGGRYQVNFLYNAEPVRNYSLADLNASATYAVGPQLRIEARGNIHSTRADIKSDTDLDKTDFAILVRYLFDVSR